MDRNSSTERTPLTSLSESFERYLQDKGKSRGGDGGNYRRNAARELERFAEWAAGDRGDDDWTGIVPDDVDRKPTFDDLDERVFREYARHLSEIGDSSRTRYKPTTAISPRGVAGVSTRAISRRITRSGRVRWRRCRRTMAASPATSRPGRPNSATPSPATSTNGPDDAVEAYTTLPEETDPRQAASALCGAEGGS